MAEKLKNAGAIIAVIFEVEPKPGAADEYLEIASALLPELKKTNGFISVERFASLSQKGKLLSLSYWRDEQAVQKWRNNKTHRLAQQKGRNELFHDYRIRVVSVFRDYGMQDRLVAPKLGKEGIEE